MASKLLSHFQNLIEVANSYKEHSDYYFFIKNYAFESVIQAFSKDQSGISESDRKTFEIWMNEYKQEKAMANPIMEISKEGYCNFLEFFFKNINFDNANVKVLETCKSLTEALTVFGGLEDLWIRRLDYFTNKINMLQPQITTKNVTSQNVDQKPKTTNIDSGRPVVYQTVSKSVEELNLPSTKDNINDTKQASINFGDYVPNLVDRSIKLPITKNSPSYQKVKDLIKTHMEYSGLEMDFHKLDLAKDHVEAAIYYLRNIELN